MKRVALVALVLCGCASAHCQPDDEARARLARQVSDVSAAAESLAREQPGLSGAAVLAELRRDPDLAPIVRGLDGFELRVLTRGGHALVLLCRPDGGAALLEDSACSPAVDLDELARPARACAFALDPVSACGPPSP